jgi:four helix bundle protein
VTGTVFKTVCEAVRAVLGRFDSDTPPPNRFWILDFGFRIDFTVNENEFKARTKQIALRVIRLVESLPKTTSAQIIGKQLLRAATSVGANYRAACRGKSEADVLHKLSIVEEEADESLYWLELLVESEIISENKLSSLIRDTNEIVAMTVASIKTLRIKQLANQKIDQSKIQNLKSKI